MTTDTQNQTFDICQPKIVKRKFELKKRSVGAIPANLNQSKEDVLS